MKNKRGMLSIVMPAYREETCIYQNLLTVCDCVAAFCPEYEVLLVNDGSPDQTLAEAMRARAVNPHIKVVSYRINRGKGGAIREGISRASGEYIAFLDADLDLAPSHLQIFLDALEKEDADIVIGSKLHKDSQLQYPLKRRIMSRGYYLLLHILFHLNLKDTQTGVKLFRAAVIQPIAAQLTTSGYAFDIEILVRAQQMGCRILEMPVTLHYQRGMKNGSSRIRIRDIVSMFLDTLRIYRELRTRR